MTSPILGPYQIASKSKRVYGVNTNPDAVNPDLVGAPEYSETTPILVFLNPAGSGRRAIFDSLEVFIVNTPGTASSFRAVIDVEARYVESSGVLRSPDNFYSGAESVHASVLEVYDEEPDLETVADTATSDAQYVDYMMRPATPGEIAAFGPSGSVILEPGRLLAVYAFTESGTVVNSRWRAKWVEESIPS
jgi:hypothetical protein